MTSDEFEAIRIEFAKSYPACVNLDQAAEIGHVALATLHDWSSQGLLDPFKSRPGRRVLLGRDAFLRFLLLNEGCLAPTAKPDTGEDSRRVPRGQ